MKLQFILIAITLAVVGCQSSDQLPPVSKIRPSAVNEGSLANATLISDTTAGLEKILGVSSINPNKDIMKFAIQQPVGKPGSRAWREMWIVNLQGKSSSFIITFKEDGLGAANFEIQQQSK